MKVGNGPADCICLCQVEETDLVHEMKSLIMLSLKETSSVDVIRTWEGIQIYPNREQTVASVMLLGRLHVERAGIAVLLGSKHQWAEWSPIPKA